MCHPAQAPAYHLLAQQLAGEGAQAHDVGHVGGIPTFREHRYRGDVLQFLPGLATFADSVDQLAQLFFLFQLQQGFDAICRQAAGFDDFLQADGIVLVLGDGLATLGFFQHSRINTQGAGRCVGCLNQAITTIEEILNPCGSLGAVTNSQHDGRDHMPPGLPSLCSLVPVIGQ